MNSKKRILLTGASGTIGYEVLKQLVEKNQYEITAFAPKTKKSIKKFSPFLDDIIIVYGDINSETDLKKICSNKDVVIHLAAIIPPLADEKPELSFKVNTQGTKMLIQKLEVLSPNVFFLYSSSIAVYGDRINNPLIKVTDEFNPSEGDDYSITKIEAEKIIRNSNLDWSIFRLGAIMGGHKMSKLMFHQPLNTSFEIATPEDTARAFVNAIEKQTELSKRIFNLGGGEKCRTTYKDFLKESFQIFGLGKFDFPQNAFAEKNFHCGYYVDGDDLNKLLDFQKDTLDSYYNKERKKVSPLIKSITSLLNRQIKKYMLKQSEPLIAIKNKDAKMINRFFN